MYINEDKEIESRINREIDSFKIAYKIMDSEGNVFVYAGYENGIPMYRTNRGRKHIDSLHGYEVVEKYFKF